MSLLESDITQKPRVSKKPKTFNPLGAIFTGIFLGLGHAYIYRSLITSQLINFWRIFSGIILVLLSSFTMVITLSLTSKSIRFFLIIDKTKTKPSMIVSNTLLFYIGLVPTYGFAVKYTTPAIPFYFILIAIGVLVLSIAGLLYLNITLLEETGARLGDLMETENQPKKILLVLSCFIPIILLTVLLALIA